MIDTVTLAGVGHELDEATGEYRTPHGDQLPGPADEEFANNQWSWIEDQLASANASDYLIVAGHYPVYSICEHGPTTKLVGTHSLTHSSTHSLTHSLLNPFTH